MIKRQNRDAIYVKRQFDTETIVLYVRWYITYRLSYRDLVAMIAERGVIVSHTTVRRTTAKEQATIIDFHRIIADLRSLPWMERLPVQLPIATAATLI